MSFAIDYAKGLNNEELILDTIRKYFNRNIKRLLNEFSKFDYRDNKYYYELKTRNNKYNDFNETIINENKINIIDNVILLFCFSDGLYYIDYSINKELFKTFKRELFQRNYRNDYNDKLQYYIYIPIEHLIKIN
jgi:hypothetical protein